MATPSLQQILQAALQPDASIQKQAEEQLAAAEAANPAQFFHALATELADESKPSPTRQLAGLQLKNALWAKERVKDLEKKKRWVDMQEDMKVYIREKLLETLKSPADDASRAACQAIAKIGGIEVPVKAWGNLLQSLLGFVTGGDVKQKNAALIALSYLAEELSMVVDENGEESVPDEVCNQTLTAVVQGMRDQELQIKFSATRALYHALVLASRAFQKQNERDFVVSVLVQNFEQNPLPPTIDPCAQQVPPPLDPALEADLKLKVACLECLVQITSRHYQHLMPYMQKFGEITWNTIKTNRDAIAIPALEFWSSLAEEEMYLLDEQAALEEEKKMAQESGGPPPNSSAPMCQEFTRQALPFLLPILLDTLDKQNEAEEEEGEWTLAMAGGMCLALVAQTVGDAVVKPVLEYVNLNFGHENWRKREAALLAYGSIMEGPSEEVLGPLVDQSFSYVLATLGDSHVAVKDTCAWTIGRIAQHHTGILNKMLAAAAQAQVAASSGAQPSTDPVTVQGQGLVRALLEGLKEEPRVAANICWIIDTLAINNAFDKGPEPLPTTPLDPFFTNICERLMEAASRYDAEERNLRAAAYSALSTVISKSGTSSIQYMDRLGVALLERLERTFQFPNQRATEISDLQGNLCGCLQMLTLRLGERVLPLSERLFQCYLNVFRHYQQCTAQQKSLHEEALLAVSALATALGEQFDRFGQHFNPQLLVGLANFEESAVCKICCDVVGDLCRALGSKMTPFIEPLVTQLYNNLQNPAVDRRIKPNMMICFGDIALAAGENFEKYLQAVDYILQEAAQTRVEHGPADNEEWVEYIHQLRVGVLQAYSGIVHGLKEAKKLTALKTKVNSILDLVSRTTEEPPNEVVLEAALNVVGDLVQAYKEELAVHVVRAPFLEKLVQDGLRADDPTVQKAAKWIKETVIRYAPKSQ
uniref:Importin N-terminal domain-containing protein n=1 Tax=Chromera velia CCMP2878 TaxID=1169474 RepID=A0A0G4HGA9_9ALVE|mmetsp:Transcript_49682/g.97905  ORF Transcript_49682/g.97905 Transcript_49682/m.97905 type:complete len:934 (+) Transcript_49682:276-3077(+)|eukprot:Cvel_27179.t1-p1 / transcript=Cvel_27179.t1 / gene=Cvel_27179 / organism=Chromera_velia_CCMP2878 / gene_product=Importin subunit beta-1, putative / transcript_product=Importin subunit beta-1, putative / location=Cvel_scaffold3352:3386-12969(-) / protein_length=933 / sequence_SO=supercontig / SO=protein_coding / is_pseudo=false